MSKRNITFAIAASWLLITLGIIASKQHTLATGKKVLLETVPIDPRDFLRGDYVRLNYKISNLDLWQVSPDKSDFKSGQKIYVNLEPRKKYWEAVAIKEKKDLKDDDIMIKGRVDYIHSRNNTLRVKYNIEKYFVPEGQGKEIEQNMRQGNKNEVSVEVIVDKSGNAVINKLYINDEEVKFE